MRGGLPVSAAKPPDFSPFLAWSAHSFLEVFVDFFEEAGGGEPFLLRPDEEREVFRHIAALDGFDDGFFQCGREFDQLRIVIELATVREAPAPCED